MLRRWRENASNCKRLHWALVKLFSEVLTRTQQHDMNLNLGRHCTVRYITFSNFCNFAHVLCVRKCVVQSCCHDIVGSCRKIPGPLLNFPVVNARFELNDYYCKYGTSPAIITSCASQCVKQALRQTGARLLQPMMKLQVCLLKRYCNIYFCGLLVFDLHMLYVTGVSYSLIGSTTIHLFAAIW